MIKASQFSLSMGLPIVDAMGSYERPKDHKKDPVWFLAGDPTAYGREDLRFPEEGYQIVR